MSKLLKIERVPFERNVKELRNLCNKIESHVRSLLTVGISSGHYETLLIPIILEKLPENIRFEISRKSGVENWKIDDFLKILKEEIVARESCDFMKKTSEHAEGGKRYITTQNLYAGSRAIHCAFCKQNRYSDRCNVVTDLGKERKLFLKIDYVLNV